MQGSNLVELWLCWVCFCGCGGRDWRLQMTRCRTTRESSGKCSPLKKKRRCALNVLKKIWDFRVVLVMILSKQPVTLKSKNWASKQVLQFLLNWCHSCLHGVFGRNKAFLQIVQSQVHLVRCGTTGGLVTCPFSG